MMLTKDFRLRYPEDEDRFPWLSLLLDFYSAFDEAVALAVLEKSRAAGGSAATACGRGCSVCCRVNKDLPVYPHELVGITWYAVEKLSGPLRETLKSQLSCRGNGDDCPFLIEDSCPIHPVRPAACRALNVAGEPCQEGEDAYHTRRRDVITPSQERMNGAFSIILPFYGITDEDDISDAAEAGFIHARAGLLLDCNWKGLADKMRAFDGNPF